MVKFLRISFLLIIAFILYSSYHAITKVNNNRVILIVYDGVRYSEIHNKFQHIKTKLQTQLYTKNCHTNNYVGTSLAGYATLFTGKEHPDIIFNVFDGPFDHDTFFTLYKSELHSSWENLTYLVRNTKNVFIVNTEEEDTNKLVYESYLKNTKRSQFVFIHFVDPDMFAHKGDFKNYVKSTNTAILYTKKIIDDNEKYQAGNTLYIVTTDHGRGDGEIWQSHGYIFPGTRDIWAYTLSKNNVKLENCSHIGIYNLVRKYLK